MRMIKVAPGAIFEIGQGSLVELTANQAAARRAKLDNMGDQPQNDDRAVYRVKENVQFMSGEVIAIPEVSMGQEHLVEGEPRPQPAPPADGFEQSRNDDERGFNTPKRGAFSRKR